MPKSNNNDLHYIQFNNYVAPKIKENVYQNWVQNGSNNEFYQYIIDRFNGSPTNSSVISSYVDLIYGQGLCIRGEKLDSPKVEKLHEYISKKDLKAICLDFQLFRELSVQIIKKRGKTLDSISHIAKNKVIPSVEDEHGNINSYWFSRDWTKRWKYAPVKYPSFGLGEIGDTEIYVGKPYVTGAEYFPNPDYLSGLQYCEIEEEISNFSLNHIKNGFSFGTVVNVPNSSNWSNEQKKKFRDNVKAKQTGSTNAGGCIVAFLGADEKPITVEDIENNTAHKQWDSLRDNARQQILTSHKCTSPSIVGVISSTGFSNTSDEMDMAESQLLKRVISPKQNFIIDCLKEIFESFGIDEDIYFKPLTDPEDEEQKKIENTDDELKMSNVCSCEKKKSDLDSFIELGEVVNDNEFDLIDEIEVDYNEELELENKLEFVSTGVARPNAKSSQDGEDYIVRYKYVGNKNPERSFCKAMMNANKVYRKEDILQLDNKVVNEGWGANGSNTYSIWLYKGGGNCHHKWNRVIYLKKGKSVDVNSPLAEIISTSEARRRRYKIETNDTLVSIEPRNMKNNGFLKPRG